jgi:hypothetical protein
MDTPKLIESSEIHEVWGCNGNKLYHEKKYSMGTGLGYICGTYAFNNDYYNSRASRWEPMYTVNGAQYSSDEYISLKNWCIRVGFYTEE